MKEDLKYWYLRDHKLFRAVSSTDLKQLCILFGFKQAKKGDIIYFSEVNVPRVYFLKKGAIKIVETNENCDENIKDIIQKGDLFGEMPTEAAGNKNEFAQVLSKEVIICSFLLSDFEALMLKKPDLAISYIKLIGLRLKRVSNNYNNLIFKDAKTRLIIYLLEWIEKEGKQIEPNKYLVENYLTQNYLAQIICTSRQTIATLIN
jgi:CRP-like cAMP-binding protein